MSASIVLEGLRQLASYHEIRGSDETQDLTRLVALLDSLSPIDLPQTEHHLRTTGSLPDLIISPVAARHIQRLLTAGPDAELNALRARLPDLLRRLLELGAITPAECSTLCLEYSIATHDDLDAAISSGRLTSLPAPFISRLTRAAEMLASDIPYVPLGRAWDILTRTTDLLRRHWTRPERVTIGGDARRFEPLVRSLVLVVSCGDPAGAIAMLESVPDIEDVRHRTPRRAIVLLRQGELDIRASTPEDYGTVLFMTTGSQQHVQKVTSRRRRLALSGHERDVYTDAGLPWIPPEVRDGTDEIEAAARGDINRLVQRRDIRGDLHMHSTFSDGQDTVETMVRTSIRLGYEYIAITDHSETAAASRTLTLEQLARQREEIARLRGKYPRIAVLQGIEAEILPDGRLDTPDSVLEQLDMVVASLHEAAGQDGFALTRRCILAMQHPLVNIITHPANQLVGRRAGYPLDFDMLYAAAVETGTALEIDGAPSHLDLDGAHARAAVAAGVTVTIDSDCHRARVLDRQMAFGIGTARRGRVEPRHVLNCRPLADVRAFVAAKRRGGASHG